MTCREGTHHLACDCREATWSHLRADVARLTRERDGLHAELESATTRGRELVEEAELRAEKAEAELGKATRIIAFLQSGPMPPLTEEEIAYGKMVGARIDKESS